MWDPKVIYFQRFTIIIDFLQCYLASHDQKQCWFKFSFWNFDLDSGLIWFFPPVVFSVFIERLISQIPSVLIIVTSLFCFPLVTDVELKRLKDAFKRTSGPTCYMTQQCFYREVLGDGVPHKVAEVSLTIYIVLPLNANSAVGGKKKKKKVLGLLSLCCTVFLLRISLKSLKCSVFF